jgi:polar amino acid transport system permease protein
MSIQLDFGAVLAQWPLLLQGIAWTAGLTAVSTVAGLGLGIAAAWARNEARCRCAGRWGCMWS